MAVADRSVYITAEQPSPLGSSKRCAFGANEPNARPAADPSHAVVPIGRCGMLCSHVRLQLSLAYAVRFRALATSARHAGFQMVMLHDHVDGRDLDGDRQVTKDQ